MQYTSPQQPVFLAAGYVTNARSSKVYGSSSFLDPDLLLVDTASSGGGGHWRRHRQATTLRRQRPTSRNCDSSRTRTVLNDIMYHSGLRIRLVSSRCLHVALHVGVVWFWAKRREVGTGESCSCCWCREGGSSGEDRGGGRLHGERFVDESQQQEQKETRAAGRGRQRWGRRFVSLYEMWSMYVLLTRTVYSQYCLMAHAGTALSSILRS